MIRPRSDRSARSPHLVITCCALATSPSPKASTRKRMSMIWSEVAKRLSLLDTPLLPFWVGRCVKKTRSTRSNAFGNARDSHLRNSHKSSRFCLPKRSHTCRANELVAMLFNRSSTVLPSPHWNSRISASWLL